jgi:hypothetical protein
MPTLLQDEAPRVVPRSALRHRPLVPEVRPFVVASTPRASLERRKHEPHTTGGPPSRLRKKAHEIGSLLTLALGMLLTVSIIIAGQLVLQWIRTGLDDLHYGRPRTYQVDAVVGHGDSATSPTHFIALNLHSHVEVIECPAGNCTRARIYVGPVIYGNDSDLVPVTLAFPDPAHSGHPDMIVLFQGSRVVFHNVSGGFQPGWP